MTATMMGRSLECLFLLQIWIFAVESFNLDLLHPVVYHSNQANDYFGFSLALHPGGADGKDVPWYEFFFSLFIRAF
jgi:hypothetical protein